MTSVQSSNDDFIRDALVRDQIGFGVMTAIFPGSSFSDEQARGEHNSLIGSGRIRGLRFRVSPEACQRAYDFVMEYRDRGIDTRYGLTAMPRYGQGGACGSFSAAVLEVSGLMPDSLRKRFYREVRIPLHLIGSPQSPVSPVGLLFSGPPVPWATELEPGVSVRFWDPQGLFDFIESRSLRVIDGVRTFAVDARQAHVPLEGFWL